MLVIWNLVIIGLAVWFFAWKGVRQHRPGRALFAFLIILIGAMVAAALRHGNPWYGLPGFGWGVLLLMIFILSVGLVAIVFGRIRDRITAFNKLAYVCGALLLLISAIIMAWKTPADVDTPSTPASAEASELPEGCKDLLSTFDATKRQLEADEARKQTLPDNGSLEVQRLRTKIFTDANNLNRLRAEISGHYSKCDLREPHAWLADRPTIASDGTVQFTLAVTADPGRSFTKYTWKNDEYGSEPTEETTAPSYSRKFVRPGPHLMVVVAESDFWLAETVQIPFDVPDPSAQPAPQAPAAAVPAIAPAAAVTNPPDCTGRWATTTVRPDGDLVPGGIEEITQTGDSSPGQARRAANVLLGNAKTDAVLLAGLAERLGIGVYDPSSLAEAGCINQAGVDLLATVGNAVSGATLSLVSTPAGLSNSTVTGNRVVDSETASSNRRALQIELPATGTSGRTTVYVLGDCGNIVR